MLPFCIILNMKNINLIKLENFQQWKKGEIPFTNGLNVIVGNTESGKSTIFRAISSILTGKMPESYIRKGEKSCKVEINFSDSSIFIRERGKKNNIATANGKSFERVGKEIPFEYFKELGKTNIEFGNNNLSLCMYSQFDPHFFITLSDYDKSKIIGVICGIDIVDKLMDRINADIRQANSNIKYLKSKIEEDSSKLDVLKENTVKKKERVDLLKSIKEAYENKFNMLEKLSKLSYNTVLIEKHINTNVNQYNLNKEKIDAFNFKKDINLLKNLLKIKNDNEKIEKTISEHQKLQKINNSLIKIGLPDLIFLKKLLKIQEKVNKYQIEESKLCIKYEEINREINNMLLEKQNLLRDFDKCPLCGSILHD